MKKEDALLYIYIYIYIHTHTHIHGGNRGWLQSTENLEEEYYDQLIYY